jgi:hypothetical protein
LVFCCLLLRIVRFVFFLLLCEKWGGLGGCALKRYG